MSEGSRQNISGSHETREDKQYQLTIDQFTTKLHEVVEEKTRELAGKDVKDIGNEIRGLLQTSGRRLLAVDSKILHPASTIEENKKIIETVNWLQSLKAHHGSSLLYALGLHFNPNFYTEDELKDIINEAPSLEFIQGVLRSGADKILFSQKTNEEIVEICTELIKKFSDQASEKSLEENRESYMSTSAHNGYQVWDLAERFVQLDEDLSVTLKMGEKFGDEFIWRKIVSERLDVLKALPIEKRVEIVNTIIKSIQLKRELQLTGFEHGTPFPRQLNSLGFGLQLADKLDYLLSG